MNLESTKQHIWKGFYPVRLMGSAASHFRARRKKYLLALGVFLLCFILLYSCMNDIYFDSDEGDVYIGGLLVSRGLLVYKDVACQHMPVMYYIGALFGLLGASTVYQMRLCFYIFFSLMWALNVIWYADRLNWFGLLLGPVLYIVQIKFIGYGTAVLSEHAQSIGITIMFYELMCFCEDYKLRAGNYARLSLAVFLSFGSAFTSVFPIFFLALTVAALEIQYFIQQDASGRALWRKTIVLKYVKLVVAVAIPFLALMLYFAIKQCLADFYYWAYEFNVTVYSKYQDTGGSVLQSLFAGFKHMLMPLKNVNLHDATLLQAELTVAAFAAFILIGVIHHNVILPVGLLLMLNACETRGNITHFHSMHAVMLQCAAIGYVAGWLAEKVKGKGVRLCACGAALALTLFPFRHSLKNIPNIRFPEGPIPGTINHVVDVITDEGDRIGNSTLSVSIYIDSKTIPAAVTDAGVRWAWEGAGDRVMEQLRADPPKVYVMDRNYAVWGYSIADYASDLLDFLDANYTPLSKYLQDNVYVLNSYYREACRRLDALYGQVTLDPAMRINAAVDQQEMIDGKLYLRGWAILPQSATGRQRIYVYLRHAGKEIGLFRTLPYERPDIEAIYGSQFRNSGFQAIVDVDDSLEAEDIDVSFIIEDETGYHIDKNGWRVMRRYATNPSKLLLQAKAG